MLATSLIVFSLLALIAAMGVFFWRQWQIAKRTSNLITRLFPALVELPEFYELLEISTDHAHFMERHGPILQRIEVQERALTGNIHYSGLSGKPVSSARWLRHADLLRAIESALKHWSEGMRPKGGAFNFVFEHQIGEGYNKGTTELVSTRHAKVVIKGGEILTAFPVLEPNKLFEPTPIGAAQ